MGLNIHRSLYDFFAHARRKMAKMPVNAHRSPKYPISLRR